MMKIVVTGCTGFVGRELVPLLQKAGAELLLVGRDVSRIKILYPGIPAAGYEDLPARGAGFDVLVHLAVLNNDMGAPPEAFRRVNVDWLLEVAAAARAAGIGKFLHFSSCHALDEDNRTSYAQSKRESAAALGSIDIDIDVVTLVLPAVYGRHWAGKLAVLNRIPHVLARPLFAVIAALKPVVNVRTIAEFILSSPMNRADEYIYLFDDKDHSAVFRFIKRSVDVAFALAAVVFLWWMFAIVWAWVRLQSSGPGIFAQTRVGQHGKPFTCYKFRTMAQGTKQAGTHEVNASAVTPVGSFLRRTKLDELPQVWNILTNEVSLIGPRPCLPNQVELVRCRTEAGILAMKPGITGYAQIHDVDMSDPVRLTAFDARYRAMRSLVLEMKILIATLLGRGQGDRTAR